MNMITPLRSGLLLLAIVLPAGRALSSTVAVNWGGNYVGQTQSLRDINADTVTGLDLDGDAQFDDSITGRAFSESVPWSPATLYSGTSATFYGGGAVGQLNGISDGWEEAEVQNHGPTDDIHFHVHNNTHAHDFHVLIFWGKTDFLNGLNAVAGVSLDESSEISLTISPDTGGHATSGMEDAEGRWVVRDGSNYYLSEATFVTALQGMADSGVRTLAGFSTTSDGNWSPYTPSGLDLHFDSSTAVFSQQNFSDITGVGFFIDNDSFGDNPFDWHFEAFSADLVPEPSHCALAVLGMAGLLIPRRRARRTP